MDDKNKLTINAKVTKYENSVNNGFAKVKILVDTHEQVANGTKFNKELLSSKMSNLNYLPIVAEFKEENNDFGTHGGKIELSDDDIKWINTTRPYGVVIENSGRFENITKKNGENITYVVCDGYVWIDRYPELNVLFEGQPNNQSMEVSILSGHYGEDNVYYVDDFEYSALCILGKDIIPAFDLAKIEGNFESKDFKFQYAEMLDALEKYLANNTSEKEVGNLEEVQIKTDDKFEQNDDENIESFDEEDVKTEETEEFVEVEENIEEEINYQELYGSKTDDYNELQIKYEKLKTEFDEYKNNYSTPKPEVERLQNFEKETLENQRKEAEETLFSQFDEKLKGVEEYEALKTKTSEFILEDLEKECFVILGKQSANFTAKPTKKEKVKIEFNKAQNQEQEDEFGDLFDKYLNK